MGISVCSDSEDASVASASISVPDPVVVSAMAFGGDGDEDMIASVFVVGDRCRERISGVQVSYIKIELCIRFYFRNMVNRVGCCMLLSIVCKRGEEVAVEVVVDRLQAADLIHVRVAQAIKPSDMSEHIGLQRCGCYTTGISYCPSRRVDRLLCPEGNPVSKHHARHHAMEGRYEQCGS